MSNIGKWTKASLVLIDAALVNLAFLAAMYVRFEFHIPAEYIEYYIGKAVLITFVYLAFFYIFRLYDSLWKFAGIDEFVFAVAGCVCGGGAVKACDLFFDTHLPDSVLLMATVFTTIFVVGFRISFRLFRRIAQFAGKKISEKEGTRVMVVGAGEGGSTVLREMSTAMKTNMRPVCLIDDSPNKRGMVKSGVKVMGNRYDIPRLAKEKNIQQIIIAIPSLFGQSRRELIEICRSTGCKVKVMPGLFELINGNVSVSQIRDVNIEDLLGRDPVVLNNKGIKGYLEGKTVMVTGGAGSIGSEIARQVLGYSPKSLILIDINENSIYELEREIRERHPEADLKVIIASVRDKRRLESLFSMYNPQIVFHAAAHKHVPLMEMNTCEAVKNNVFGTLNLAMTASRHRTEKFVMISTDKAVNPTNVMGVTKRICEMIIQTIAADSETEFGAVRFGNVLGSNGSVIPIFRKQIEKGGPVTVTDRNITRFFMTIPEAVQLVLEAGAFAAGGEIYILDMGQPVKIYDLA